MRSRSSLARYRYNSPGIQGDKVARCIQDDFEDIAIAGNRIFMVTSTGKLYEFREDNNPEFVQAVVYGTEVEAFCEIEGLCYDPARDELLLAFKTNSIKKNEKRTEEKNKLQTTDRFPVYAFSLKTMSPLPLSGFMLDRRGIATAAGRRSFMPSGIAFGPIHGTFRLISSRSRLIVEIDSSDGVPLSFMSLPKKYHPQPEGIAFLSDNTLLVSDEGHVHGTISLYGNKKRISF
ncbi:MAG: hypothetical protein JZU65_20340 [Chlorobium sp.]|nr:hypothetical protein [Chlorobium sp.]